MRKGLAAAQATLHPIRLSELPRAHARVSRVSPIVGRLKGFHPSLGRAAKFLLRDGYDVVMMDSRAHGESGGDMATYGWKERYDTLAITNKLCSTEQVRHLAAHTMRR